MTDIQDSLIWVSIINCTNDIKYSVIFELLMTIHEHENNRALSHTVIGLAICLFECPRIKN